MQTFNEADPLSDHLHTLLLPEMEFSSTSLEMIIECLRHMATRALATSAHPVPGGISITLFAPPSRLAAPATLSVTLGMTLGDALAMLAQAHGLQLLYGNLGVLLCPMELALCYQQLLKQDPALPEESCLTFPLSRDHRLRLLAFYPVLAISNHPLRRAWSDAFLASDRTPQAAYGLANEIVGKVPGDPCPCLVNLPHFLPDVPDDEVPSR